MKLGRAIGWVVGDWVSPDKVVEIENEEMRQEFLRVKKPFDDEVTRLEQEQAKIKSRQDNVNRLLREKHAELAHEKERAARLEKERRDLEANRQHLEAEEKTATAKTALMAQLSRQFLVHDGDSLFADIRRAVSVGFDSAHESLENHLRERVRAIKSEVQTALKEARAKHVQGEAAVKEALETNQEDVSGP